MIIIDNDTREIVDEHPEIVAARDARAMDVALARIALKKRKHDVDKMLASSPTPCVPCDWPTFWAARYNGGFFS